MAKTMEQLDLQLCSYCRIGRRTTIGVNDSYCFDSNLCMKAYENYLEVEGDEDGTD